MTVSDRGIILSLFHFISDLHPLRSSASAETLTFDDDDYIDYRMEYAPLAQPEEEI